MLTLGYLAELFEKNRAAAQARVREFAVGGRHLAFNSRPAIMGVINLSPDSWYRESVCLRAGSALRRGKVLQAQGADIINVGAESTLAHAARLDAAAQLAKLLPVIGDLHSAGLAVSVETYEPAVARPCLDAGADVLNLTGAEHSEDLFRSVADHGAALILCYVQGRNVREVADFDFGPDPVAMMRDYFARRIEPRPAPWRREDLPRPGAGLLLSQPPGQRRPGAPPNDGLPQYLPPALARFPALPGPAPCLRVFRR